MGARFGAQASTLLVVLLDVSLLVPGFQAVIFLLRTLDSTSRAAGMHTTLEKARNNVWLTNSPAAVEQPSKQGVEALRGTENQVVATLHLIQIPGITVAILTHGCGEQGDATVDPAL